MSRRILIAGASIAGCTAALALGRHGHDVTVVERSPGFRDGGQNVDVRGAGREVLRRLGLEDAALAAGTGEEGTVWVDADGTEVAWFGVDDVEGDGPTAEMEILRGDLAKLLYDRARDHAAFRFGDSITDIDDRTVIFASGSIEAYDAIVVAEGVGSATRERVFTGENDPRWMDMTIAYFTIPRAADDDAMWRWFNAPGKRSVSLRPDPRGTTRAMLSVQGERRDALNWPIERQKAWLRETFADAGWETPRVLAALDSTEDFYFDVLRQVRMPRWSKGRVVLTGDAAWCVTPLGGIGATLAVTGAYVLAEEIARATHPDDAFASYEEAMRPMVEEGQGVPKIAPRLLHPRSRVGIRLLHAALGVAARPSLRDFAAKLFARPPKEPDLGKYREPALR